MLNALRAGGSVVVAARAGGVAEDTVRTWIKAGRRQQEGRFEAIADVFDARRGRLAAVQPTGSPGALPERRELLRRLDEQSQAGSTRATEVLLRELPEEPANARATARRLLAAVP